MCSNIKANFMFWFKWWNCKEKILKELKHETNLSIVCSQDIVVFQSVWVRQEVKALKHETKSPIVCSQDIVVFQSVWVRQKVAGPLKWLAPQGYELVNSTCLDLLKMS